MVSPRHLAQADATLFSYGTLQQADVQLGSLGRLLQRKPDVLVGYEMCPSPSRIWAPY